MMPRGTYSANVAHLRQLLLEVSGIHAQGMSLHGREAIQTRRILRRFGARGAVRRTPTQWPDREESLGGIDFLFIMDDEAC